MDIQEIKEWAWPPFTRYNWWAWMTVAGMMGLGLVMFGIGERKLPAPIPAPSATVAPKTSTGPHLKPVERPVGL